MEYSWCSDKGIIATSSLSSSSSSSGSPSSSSSPSTNYPLSPPAEVTSSPPSSSAVSSSSSSPNSSPTDLPPEATLLPSSSRAVLQKRVTDLQVQLAKAQAETISSSSPRLVSPSSSSSPPPPASTPIVVVSPCAACKILRRHCAEKCVLAPYFPPNDPIKFSTAHRVFGASNIIKLLQELPESQREDAVSSMVYEANARIRDPVYGCAGAICQLQMQINDLQEQLAKAHAMPTRQSHG